MNRHLSVEREDSGMELDEFLCRMYPHLAKGFLRRQVRAGRVLVGGATVVPSARLRADDVVSIDFEEADEAEPRPSHPRVELTVLYEDEHVLAIDKPAALPVEPDRWAPDLPNLAGVLADLGMRGSFRPRLVHRLDKDTSGVVVAARTLEAERSLRTSFDQHRVDKEYLALVEGEHPLSDGEAEEIDRPIGPDRRRSGRMRVCEEGKPAQTSVEVEQRFRGFTLLRCRPRTGRTHQLRVHLAAEGFPLVVDPLYGRRRALMLSEIKAGYRPKRGRPERPLIDRLSLHAARITFPDPADEAHTVSVEAPLPEDLARTLKQLAKVRVPRR